MSFSLSQDEDTEDEEEDWEEKYEDEYDGFLDDLDDLVFDLLDNNEYDGATIGISRAGKTIFADGYGDWGKKALHASAVMPISSISKTLTAAATLQLVEQEDLDLKAKVFGKKGILHHLKPVDGVPKDPRVNDITVEHLLRHSAGWDQGKGPIYDPMLNKLYLHRGQEGVVDIAKAMKVGGYLSQYDIIRFMLSTPLDFDPGARSKQSNFGYSVLGRIIEEVSQLPYEEYVKKFILNPCGMLHTRIGPRFSDEYMLTDKPGNFRSEMDSNLVHSVVEPVLLDSAMGWYSNVYDMSRFMSCLLGYAPRQLLSSAMVEFMFRRPSEPTPENDESWRGIGFHVRKDGAFWMDSDINDNDVILFHKGPWGSPLHFNPSETMKDDVTVIALMTNNRFKKLKSAMERIVNMAADWPNDMADVCIDQELADLEIDDKIVRYQLGESHLLGYVNALRMSQYVPTWIHGYNDGASTQFAIVAERRLNRNDADFELLVEASKKRLYSHIAQLQSRGYYVTFIQSYESWSHDDRMTHLALLAQATHKLEPERWAIAEDLDSYFGELGSSTGRGYTLEAQSIVGMRKGPHVSYLMRKLDDPSEGRFMSFHSLTLKELEDKTRENAGNDYTLSYLDTYVIEDEPRFSAVYRQHAKGEKWILQTDITFDDFQSQGEYWEDMGYVPKLVVGYEDERGLRFAAFWTKP